MLNRCIVAGMTLFTCATAWPADMYVYFGTHRAGKGNGFSLAHFDTETGVLTKPKYLLDADAPAFFVIDREGKHLYASNSVTSYQGKPEGTISSYEIDRASGDLKLLSRVPAGGGDSSFISLDKTEKFALDANYQGGNVCVYAIQPDGSFGARTAFDQHTGKGPDPQRQAKPYAHSILTDPSNRFALVPDLGVDKVYIYHFDEHAGTLAANDPAFVSVKPGAGPRHVRFHPNGKWVYLVTEMGSLVVGFNWDPVKGSLSEFQSISTLPADFKGTSVCAEMEIHPNGQFLYASNRGHDSLSVFKIDPVDGKLTLIQTIPSGGKTPRNFAFDPTGQWILCTNHDSNNAVVFQVDSATGRLTQKGEPVSVPYPFCERFLPVAK